MINNIYTIMYNYIYTIMYNYILYNKLCNNNSYNLYYYYITHY